MPRSLYDFKFPDAEGNYWYLIWIGKIHQSRRQKKVMLFFINTTYCNDLDINFKEDALYKTQVPVSYLADIHLGMIYSISDKKFVSYKLGNWSNFYLTQNLLEGTFVGIPLINNSYYSFLKEEGEIDIECMKYILPFKNPVPVFVTPYCIAEYLFFRSDRLVNKILSGELLDGFKLSSAKFFFDETNQERVVELLYDASQVTVEDATIIVPYLFMRNYVGIKLLKGIYSNLNSTLRNSMRLLEPSAYLRFNINQLSNYKISLEGKFLNIGNKDNVRDQQMIISYRITNIDLGKNPYFIDRVDLIPYNSKNSTKDRKNHDKINVARPIFAETKKLTLVLDQEATNASSSLNDIQITDQNCSSSVKVRLISREDQLEAYNVIPFTIGEIDGFSRELENLDSSVNYYKENIQKEFDSIELISNYTYFKRLVQELIDQFHLDVNKNPFKISDNEGFVIFSGTKLDIVEIHFELKFFYLVEFGKGFIGVFNCCTSIDPMRLKIILLDILELSDKLFKGQVLWTLVNRNKQIFKSKYGIEIQTGIEHKRQGTVGDVYTSPAELIYYDRIKKNL